MSRHVGPDEASDDQIALEEAQRELRDVREECFRLRTTIRSLESALKAAATVFGALFPEAGRMITYADACVDPNLFGDWFGAASWGTWRVLDKALFGQPLTAGELETFQELTGRDEAPTEPAKEAWIIAGRRSGKDVKAASLACYIATVGAELHGYRKRLVRGERGVVQILAVDRDQARVAFNYLRAFFDQPMLAKLLKRETADTLELTNGLAIEITTSDRRRVRGRTVICAIFDEVAHWRDENTNNPDLEIYRAVKPAMITIPNALLIGISSPHARKGLLHDKFTQHYGQPGNVLVAKAPTWVMNPTLSRDEGEIAEDYKNDPAYASAEWGSEFRVDVESYVAKEIIEANTDVGVFERPYDKANKYVAFTDPSGGSSDSFTLAIAHVEDGMAVLDLIREARAPFTPSVVVEEFADVVKAYKITTVYGDKYASGWPPEQFSRNGVMYEASELNKSEIYLAFLPMLNSRTVAMLESDRLERQLLSLERKTARGGRDTVDHPRGLHDDVANAAAGALTLTQSTAAASGSSNFNRQIEYGPATGVA